MTATMSGVAAIRIVLEQVVSAVGPEKGHKYRDLTLARVGDSGATATDWLRALGAVIAADGDVRAQRAFLAALDEIDGR